MIISQVTSFAPVEILGKLLNRLFESDGDLVYVPCEHLNSRGFFFARYEMNKYQQYEFEKRRLRFLNLSSDQYDKAIKEIIKRLGI